MRPRPHLEAASIICARDNVDDILFSRYVVLMGDGVMKKQLANANGPAKTSVSMIDNSSVNLRS